MIEQFVAQSIGEWRSMRSGHSLAFKQFEEIVSTIKIKPVDLNDTIIEETIKKSSLNSCIAICPFSIEWLAESSWDNNKEEKNMNGKSILVPINVMNNEGYILRSLGYAEKVSAISKFNFLNDGTIILNTDYKQTIAEERIWFLSENVRCRSSVIRSKSSKAILQTSFASEIKRLFINE